MLAGDSVNKSRLLDKGPERASNEFSNSSAIKVQKGEGAMGKSEISIEGAKRRRHRNKKQQTQFTTVLKFFNIIIGIAIIGFGAYCYVGGIMGDQKTKNTVDFVNLIMPGYIALSGLIILSIECHIGFIVRNMRFLYNYFGRGLFNIYVGILPLTLIKQGKDDSGDEQDEVFQIIIYIVVALLCLIGLMYICAKIFCCAKEGDKRKKQRRQYSDSDSDSDD